MKSERAKMIVVSLLAAFLLAASINAAPLLHENPDKIAARALSVPSVVTVMGPPITMCTAVVTTVVVTAPRQTSPPSSTASRDAVTGSTMKSSQNVPMSSSVSHGAQTSSQIAASSPVSVSGATTTPSLDLPTNAIIPNLQPTDLAFTDLAVFAHNIHRQNHTDTDDVVYNQTLVGFAKAKADSCVWDESLPQGADGVGMNIAEGTYIGAANISGTIEDLWYNGEINLFPGFGQANPDMSNFQNWGHFSQVVWRASKSIGCWSSECPASSGGGGPNAIGSGFFSVCMYYPPGNVGGEYATQIGTPLGHPTVHGN